MTLADLARLANVFYIGGTKVGALFGEAVVIPDPAIQKDFRYMIKRMGGMLAKGRLLGIQFEVLFQDGLYEQLGRRTVALAQKLAEAFGAKRISMLHKSPTNQQFPILTQTQRDKLGEKYAFSFWQQVDEDGRRCVSAPAGPPGGGCGRPGGGHPESIIKKAGEHVALRLFPMKIRAGPGWR